jgi:adenosylcobinamide kinase/adenosylcobinamide-phosphate guanylyltransferase
VLVDCVTLWVNNLMYRAEQNGVQLRESEFTRHCEEVLEAGSKRPGAVIFVTNEVGLGIVPDNALARRYRDLAGWCNQRLAIAAGTVTLVTCGLPLHLKGNK